MWRPLTRNTHGYLCERILTDISANDNKDSESEANMRPPTCMDNLRSFFKVVVFPLLYVVASFGTQGMLLYYLWMSLEWKKKQKDSELFESTVCYTPPLVKVRLTCHVRMYESYVLLCVCVCMHVCMYV
jgi:hypothetical protein